jgi:acyl dehydratase
MIDLGIVGQRFGPTRRSWDSTDCLLYALGVGAGAEDPCSELEFTTENSESRPQRALPSMATVLAGRGLPIELGTFEGGNAVHGEQQIELFDEIPVSGAVDLVTEITDVFDKGSGAVIVAQVTGTNVSTGTPLFVSRRVVFVRGEGGWGGDRGPLHSWERPKREPDQSISLLTRPEQALVYRLSGDRHRLHSDPVVAKGAGYQRPILQGLCTFGATARVLTRALCNSEPSRFRTMRCRFSAPVLPGELLLVELWAVAAGEAMFRTVDSQGHEVLNSGVMTFNRQTDSGIANKEGNDHV